MSEKRNGNGSGDAEDVAVIELPEICCANCMFGIPNDDAPNLVNCHGNPPQVILIERPTAVRENIASGGQQVSKFTPITMWPTLSMIEFCGLFIAHEKPKSANDEGG